MQTVPRFLRTTTLLSLLLGVAACAGTGGSGGETGRAGSSTLITAEEIEPLVNQNVYEIVRRLRPAWLRARSPSSAQGEEGIGVIVDGVLQRGGPTMLRGMSGTEVRELRYVNARDATTRYGTGMTLGAIEVFTRR